MYSDEISLPVYFGMYGTGSNVWNARQHAHEPNEFDHAIVTLGLEKYESILLSTSVAKMQGNLIE